MNTFFKEYVERLEHVKEPRNIADIYRWFWDKRNEIPHAIAIANQELGLQGEFELQPDLPCLAIGATKGLLIVSANPGWNEKDNQIENKHCQSSPENYCSLMTDFFELHPKLLGKRIRWWSKPFSFLRLLPEWHERFGEFKFINSAEKWRNAHTSKLIGGWELFPFHSKSDGITHLALNDNGPAWLIDCMKESLKAAIRLSPEIILVASKSGCVLCRKMLGSEVCWQKQVLGSEKKRTDIYYCRYGTQTEIIAIPHQIFSAHRTFTNSEIFQAVDQMRAEASKLA